MNNCGLIDPSQKTSSKINKLAIIFMAVLSLSTASHILADDWTFDKITDSTELADYGISSYMRIDAFDIADGNVAFSAYDSIFKSIDGQLTEVVNGNTVLPDGGNDYKSAHVSYYRKAFSFDGSNVIFADGPVPGWGGVEGVYTDEGGSIKTVWNTNTLIPGTTKEFTSCITPVFSGSNMAFYVYDDSYTSEHTGIYKYINGQYIPAATTAMLPQLAEGQRWSDRGLNLSFDGNNITNVSILYDENASTPFSLNRSIYSDIGGSLTLVANSQTPVPGYNGTYAVLQDHVQADESQVVFQSYAYNDGQNLGDNISRYDEQGLSVIIDEQTLIPGTSETIGVFSLYAIANNDIFILADMQPEDAYYRVNDEGISQVVSEFQVLADGSGYVNYRSGRGVILGLKSSNEMTVYAARYSETEDIHLRNYGLFYSVTDGEVLPIIKPGDLLDGRVVEMVDANFEADFENNQIVFSVDFENGSRGIYLATLPEPTTAALFALVTFPLIHRRR